MTKKLELGVTIEGVYLDVCGYYSPEEPRILYDGNMTGYPGSYADFEIISVSVNDVNITELISDDVYNEIIEKVIDNQLNQEQ